MLQDIIVCLYRLIEESGWHFRFIILQLKPIIWPFVLSLFHREKTRLPASACVMPVPRVAD